MGFGLWRKQYKTDMNQDIAINVIQAAAKVERNQLLNELMDVYQRAELDMPVEVFKWIQRKTQ